MTANDLSSQPAAPPTALEALQLYFKTWAKYDSTLKQYIKSDEVLTYAREDKKGE